MAVIACTYNSRARIGGRICYSCGGNIQRGNKLGIKPDVEIGNDFDFYINDSKKDIQLEKAKDILAEGF